MKFKAYLPIAWCVGLFSGFSLVTAWASKDSAIFNRYSVDHAQVPDWSGSDLDTFLHGSMSTEFVPEPVLQAFIKTYPDLFPNKDFTQVGLIADPGFGWPIGFSRSQVPHLGGLTSVGINCAACHVGQIESGGKQVRVLGVTSHFDAEGFFGAVLGAGFRTALPENMGKFLAAYLAINSPDAVEAHRLFTSKWEQQKAKVNDAITADPSGAKGLPAGSLQPIRGEELRLDAANLPDLDLAALSTAMLKLFHNMRAALHVPDQPPKQAPPASGPGRNDAFGLLSAVLFGAPQPYAPVKYGLVWNMENRPWVHWDLNTRSPLGRNLLASLGLGAPLIGHHGQLDFALVQRQTDLSEKIRPPTYPFGIDKALADRGAQHFQAKCASCHDGPETDARLYNVAEIGTQPLRAELFTTAQADLFNNFLSSLEIPGYHPGNQPGIRSTGKYFAPTLHGVWARSPYLHNGSVRTMQELLSAPSERAKSFHRGSRRFDTEKMGYEDNGPYLLDTSVAANSNAGHAYGNDLSGAEKRELIEYLKSL